MAKLLNETATVRAIRALLPQSPQQENTVLQADAELLRLNGQLYAFSMDEFSAEEDGFPDADPVRLGANLAVATLSDLLACGCRPQFYLQSIVEPRAHQQEETPANAFALQVSQGVGQVLQACGCFLLGGDLGQSASWRYTGMAFGLVEERAITRILPVEQFLGTHRQTLWLTGALGDGNLCALIRNSSCLSASINATGSAADVLFELRLREAQALRGLATACMDTSGGLMDSLFTLQALNPKYRFQIYPETLPYDQAVQRYASQQHLPLQAFAFGGAGEYELLFTTAAGLKLDWATAIGTVELVAAGQELGCGDVVGHLGAAGVYWGPRLLPADLPEPRSFARQQDYLKHLLEFVYQWTS